MYVIYPQSSPATGGIEPTCCVATSEILLRGARAEGHAVTVLPGVSCLDLLWADLGIDPTHGCLVLTADALLRAGPRLTAALGRELAHLALLMPEAAGDPDSGVDLACGRASLVCSSRVWPSCVTLRIVAQRAARSPRCRSQAHTHSRV